MKTKVGLFFGSFNPIHVGHLTLANYLVEYTALEQVWLVVTPHNPHKKKSSLLEDHHRLAMVRIALEEYPKLKASDIEFGLPQPNYTVNTLAYLEEQYPDNEFALIMGEDNLKTFHKWKNSQTILERHPVYVYPRISQGTVDHKYKDHEQITKVAAPIMELSSTFIRRAIAARKNVRPMLPHNVWVYLDQMNFYK